MKALVPYHGGKSKLADWIVSLMPPHRVYIQPFAGSAAVLLAKRPSPHEILNDVDGHIVNFFRMLRDRREDLEVACRLTPYARDEFYAADLGQDVDDLERARRWWIRVNQGFGAITRPGNGWALSSKSGGSDADAVANRLSQFAAVADRLLRVAIENRDAIDVIDSHGAADALVYADPPYLGETREPHSVQAYRHEYTSETAHRALAEALHAAEATVLLSGYDSPLYDELYSDWPRIDRRTLRWSNNGSTTARPHVTEVIWSNVELNTEHVLDFDMAVK